MPTQMKIRLPEDLKTWIAVQAEINGSSKNSEIIRAIRERMERLNEPHPKATERHTDA